MSIVNSDLMRLYELASYEHENKNAPIIGIPLDAIDSRNDTGGFWYSEYPWYAIGRRYCDAIVRNGGIPVLMGYNLSSVDRLADIIDGLLLAGVGYDIDPIFYGEHFRHRTTITKPARSQFEWAITQKMMDRNRPVLGINSGMQLINVMRGGTLFQHLIEEVPDSLTHAQSTLMIYPHHDVQILGDTSLFEMIEESDEEYASSIKSEDEKSLLIKTNSYHHQGIKKLGDGLKINAVSSDGIIEGIEYPDSYFCIGVQWNAEFLTSLVDFALFKKFIQAASDG